MFTPKISIRYGTVRGYGAPGYDWVRGSYDNRVLFYFTGSAQSVAVLGERERVKWEREWESEDKFRDAISDKGLEYPLCSNCGQPIGEHGSNCLEKWWCTASECRAVVERARKEYDERIANSLADRDRQFKEDQERALQSTEEAIRGAFHWKNGWFFRRTEDGSVRIMRRNGPESIYLSANAVIPALEWASIVCAVSEGGEDSERWQAAQRFHGIPQKGGA